MTLKQFKPTTPSLRGRRIVVKNDLWRGKSFKSLTKGLSKTGGRSNTGRITVRHIGGGNKRLYRLIDFKRLHLDPAIVVRLEYDPNRSAFIALIKYLKTETYSYILAPENLTPGDFINKNNLDIGSVISLRELPVSTSIHNIEIQPGLGGKLARAAGTYGKLLSKDNQFARIQLSSKEIRLIPVDARATIGVVSNIEHSQYKAGKAGVNRWLGIRPHVRGEAMNPVDHPHGGRTRGARIPVSPWGKITRGKKTRKNINKFKLN